MRNIACNIGYEGRLKGILSLPADDSQHSVAMILVSAGFTAKMGPYRVYSRISASLANLGVLTLRFDLGGIGNSQSLHPDKSLLERTTTDIRDAVDFVTTHYGVSQIVVGGLCSGAEDALRYAKTDERVTGIVMIDPHAYRTRMWYAKNILSRHFFNRVICKFLRICGFISVARDNTFASDGEGIDGGLINYRYMCRPEAITLLEALLGRGGHAHYIYTAGRSDRFNHVSQLKRMFAGVDLGPNVTIDHLPRIGHTQIFEQDRDELVSTIERRIEQSYQI